VRRGKPAGPLGILPHRPGIPHNVMDWIAASVLCETFLAMTQSEENVIATPLCGSQ